VRVRFLNIYIYIYIYICVCVCVCVCVFIVYVQGKGKGGCLFAGLLPRMTGFDPRRVRFMFMGNEVVMGYVCFLIVRFFPCHYHSTSAPY